MANDFLECLTTSINDIPGLKMRAVMNYPDETESLGVYALPGGRISGGDMLGRVKMTLNFEIAIHTKSIEIANNTMWEISKALGDLSLDIPSQNGSYEFESLEPEAPSLNERDEKGWYLFILDITATIITNKGEIANG
ncbi:minor capsid protein [Lactococcus lactis]|uniref:Minor capsid protein n=1 Tax=Lactococcus lactis TaxID=1358 RepID=A0AAE4NQ39_9LACT|nr:minor capsid protein [Lactococcus lactis]MDV2633192.1 minor capsid protein [Lactococcus lactis]